MGPEVIRFQLDRFAKLDHRFIRLAFKAEDSPQVDVCFWFLWANPDSGASFGECLVGLPFVRQSDDEVQVGIGKVGIEADRDSVLGDRLVRFPLLLERGTESSGCA